MANVSEDAIITDDIPVLDADFWAKAQLVEPKAKSVVSLRLSQDVVEHFKATSPKGYTTKMAAVLAAYVSAQKTG